MFDIDKMIESLKEINADSMEYDKGYIKDGVLYKIKLSIEVMDEGEAQE